MTRQAKLPVLNAVATFATARMRFARDRRVLRVGLTAFLLVLLTSFCRPVLLLVFPGILLVPFQWRRPCSLADLLPAVVGTSMAFWVVSFWFLPYFKVPLSWWTSGMIFLAITLWIGSLWRHPQSVLIIFDREEVLALFLLMAAAALRSSLFWRWPLAPAGADMSMHSYLAALIVAMDAVPSSHRPLLPIDGFGAYPVGFPVLTALISLVGDLPVFRSALLMEVITVSFLTVAFYRFLRVFWDRQTSAMVALLVTFLPRNPQYFIQWGGDPTLLALAFLVMGLGSLPSFKTRMSPGAWCICALLATASVFTHLIPVIGGLYAVIPVMAYAGPCGLLARRGERRHIIWNLLGIGAICAILLAPSLPNLLSVHVSTGEIEWVKHFQRLDSGGAWGGTLGNALVTIPQYLTEKIFGGHFLTLSCLGLITLSYCRPHLAVPSIICVFTVIGLVINSMYWVLPFSYAIYPERTALLLLLPFSLGIGALLDGVRHVFAKKYFTVYIMAALISFVSVRYNDELLYKGLVPNSLVTKADMEAMRWIQDNTEPGVVFRNYYGDAGLWIPAIAFRGITEPHLNPFYFDEFRAASTGLEARYVYVGKKKALGAPISLDEFESAPDRYRKVYDRDGVVIYEIINQGTKSEVDQG